MVAPDVEEAAAVVAAAAAAEVERWRARRREMEEDIRVLAGFGCTVKVRF